MIKLEEAYLLAVFVNAMFAVALILLPIGKSLTFKVEYAIYNRSRWYSVAAQLFLTAHFALRLFSTGMGHASHYTASIDFLLVLPGHGIVLCEYFQSDIFRSGE